MTLYSAAMMLFLVMDPLGNIPAFLTVLHRVEPKRRKKIVLRETFIAFITLTVFLFFGKYILDGMQISQPALSVSGGIILFLISIRMIFTQEEDLDRRVTQEPFIVPLAIPFVAGPSTMTLVILISTREPTHIWNWFFALTIAWLASTVILVFADNLRKILGERGLLAVEKLMGMVLTTMAVQMFLTGIAEFLHLH